MSDPILTPEDYDHALEEAVVAGRRGDRTAMSAHLKAALRHDEALRSRLAEAEAERDDLRASRESWVTARAEVISLDLAASRAALAEAVELLRRLAPNIMERGSGSIHAQVCAFIEAHG